MEKKQISAMTGNKQHLLLLLFVCCFLFLAFIMWCTPLSSDDLEFLSLDFGGAEDVLSYALEYGNGRLLGNISALTFVRAQTLSVILRAFMLASCVFLLPSAIGVTSVFGYVLSFVLLMAIDPLLFGQVYVWTSGFCNYIPPVWMMLVIIYVIQRYPGLNAPLLKILACVAVFVLGVASQLFVEHSTLINVVLALCFVIKGFKDKQKRCLIPSVIWLAAAVIGAAVMFLIPVLFYVEGNRSTGYRSFHLGSLAALVFSCAKNALRLGNHYFSATGLPVCAGAAVTVHLTRGRRTEKTNAVLYALSVLPLIYILFGVMLSAEGWYGELAIVHHVIALLFVLAPIAVWVLAALGFADAAMRSKILCLLALAVLSILPMLVVSPTPVRVIFQSYVFVVMAVILCFTELMGTWSRKLAGYAKALTCSGAALLALLLGLVFLNTHYLADVRERHILQEIEKGADTVQVFQIPYEYLDWDTTWSYGYVYYRSEFKDVAFYVSDYDEWMNDILDTVQ